ncbi:putative secreted protein [Streptomyces hygroscopicus subsp. jinggangensis 5008]|nr:putative secreted protein [Streptomyces hygroscopicus subsp. jinggangensis 5008]AGF63129.1 putative secreted protein [Streptomyces hygroscopicus subsp. jinggangensis TL01]
MSRRRTLGTKKKLALLVGAAAVAGGGAFALASTSNAAQGPQDARTLSAGDSTVCQGLATALGNNERFIADQKAKPDAQSAARIANRQAVVEQIKVQQKASGCTVGESAQGSQAAQGGDAGQSAGPQDGGQQAGGAQQGGGQQAGGVQQGGGRQVCKGSTVTLSGEGGAPAASSDQFPAGTTLKVTNLDNDKSTTVKVTSVSGSCVLLNNAAFEQVREPGKFLIRRAVIEKVG